MSFRHAVYIMTQIKREVSEVERVVAAENIIRIIAARLALQDATDHFRAKQVVHVEEALPSTEHAPDHVHRKFIMPRWHGRVRREDAARFYRLDVIAVDGLAACFLTTSSSNSNVSKLA